MKRRWIVFTPNGDWRDIYATDERAAKRVVFNLTCGRIRESEMSAQLD